MTAPESTVVDDDQVVVKGTSETDAQITLNGNTVLLSSDNTFSVPLYLHPGINHVRVESQNVAGRVHVIERDILRPRSH